MLSTPYANKLLAKVFSNTGFSFSGYLGLHTGDPGTTGANELAGTGYARQALSPVNFTAAAANGQIVNTTALTYLNMPAATITNFGIWDALTGGGFVQGGALTQPQSVGPTTAFLVGTGLLVLQFSDSPQLTDITTYTRNRLLDYMYRGVAFATAPVFASLHTASPGQGGANELIGRSYARQQVSFGTAASQLISNSADVVFLDLPAADVGYLGAFDQSGGGNLVLGAQLYVAGVPGVARLGAGDALAFLAGTYNISAD